jgi:hypothetical protein
MTTARHSRTLPGQHGGTVAGPLRRSRERGQRHGSDQPIALRVRTLSAGAHADCRERRAESEPLVGPNRLSGGIVTEEVIRAGPSHLGGREPKVPLPRRAPSRSRHPATASEAGPRPAGPSSRRTITKPSVRTTTTHGRGSLQTTSPLVTGPTLIWHPARAAGLPRRPAPRPRPGRGPHPLRQRHRAGPLPNRQFGTWVHERSIYLRNINDLTSSDLERNASGTERVKPASRTGLRARGREARHPTVRLTTPTEAEGLRSSTGRCHSE